jgi:alcohol dehydrogenase
MIARAIGAEVVAVDINDEKLRRAEKLGASHVINSAEEEYAPEAIQILLDGGADVTIDALGDSDLINLGIRSLRRQGTHVQVGLTEGMASQIQVNSLAGQELKIHGSHGMSATEYPRLFDLIASGACNPRELVSGIISLEQSPRVLMRFGEAPPLGIGVIDMQM